MAYVVLRLATSLNSGLSSMKEIDRGLCESIGWIGLAEASEEGEMYAMVLPGKRVVTERKKGISDLLFSKKEEVAATPPQLVFKCAHSDGSTVVSINMDAAMAGGYTYSNVRGGHLLCLTLFKDDPKRGRRVKSQFFRLVANVREDIVVKRKKAVEAPVEDGSRPKYKLEQVDQSMKEVSCVSWMYSKQENLCAIVVDSRLSVAAFTPGNSRLLITMDVSNLLPSPKLFAAWKSDRIVVVDGLMTPLSIDLDEAESPRHNPQQEKHFLWEVNSAYVAPTLATHAFTNSHLMQE